MVLALAAHDNANLSFAGADQDIHSIDFMNLKLRLLVVLPANVSERTEEEIERWGEGGDFIHRKEKFASKTKRVFTSDVSLLASHYTTHFDL